MNKWREKVRRKIKLIRTMPKQDKLIWVLYIGLVLFIIYLRGLLS